MYVGSWDHSCTRLSVRTGKLVWSTLLDGEINSSPALADGTIFIGDNSGTLTALDARTGAIRWKSRSFSRLRQRARVLLRHPDRCLRARLRLEHRRHRVRIRGRHRQPALGAPRRARTSTRRRPCGTGGSTSAPTTASSTRSTRQRADTRWVREMPAAVHGAPTVMAGLVYLSTCGFCGQNGVRSAKKGPNGTYALDARTGKLVWQFPDGQYSPRRRRRRERSTSPAQARVYGLDERSSAERAGRPRRCPSAATRGTTSGRRGR